MPRRSRLEKRLPAYLWDPAELQGLRAYQRASFGARGLQRELMDWCYAEGSIPQDLQEVANHFGELLEVVAALWPEIAALWVPKAEGRLTSPIIEAIVEAQNRYRSARSTDRSSGPRTGQVVQNGTRTAQAVPTGPGCDLDRSSGPGASQVVQNAPGTTNAKMQKHAKHAEKSACMHALHELPLWLRDAIQAQGLERGAEAALEQVGPEGLQLALVRLASMGATASNPGALLRRQAPSLAEEGRSELQSRIGRALSRAPMALSDPRWECQPDVFRADLEARVAWCEWQAAEAILDLDARQEATAEPRAAMLTLLLERHPEAGAVLHAVEALLQDKSPAAANRARPLLLLRHFGLEASQQAPVQRLAGVGR